MAAKRRRGKRLTGDITQAQLANLASRSRATISNWAAANSMPLGPRGEPTLATMAWILRKVSPDLIASPEQSEQDREDADRARELVKAKLRTEHERGDLLETQRLEAQRRLVDADQIREMLADRFVRVRQRVMAVAVRASPRCVGADEAVIHDILEDELRLALTELADEDLPKNGNGTGDG